MLLALLVGMGPYGVRLALAAEGDGEGAVPEALQTAAVLPLEAGTTSNAAATNDASSASNVPASEPTTPEGTSSNADGQVPGAAGQGEDGCVAEAAPSVAVVVPSLDAADAGIVAASDAQEAPVLLAAADGEEKDATTDSEEKAAITTPSPVDMFRLYNPNSGEHFYTASDEERSFLMAAGWKYEGVGWVAPSVGDPVFRLYSGTDHHYTTSEAERDSLVSVGWKYEGVGWYSDPLHTIALLRQFNPNVNPAAATNNSGSHNYTTSEAERDYLVSVGWLSEGVGWYALEGGRPAASTSYIYLDAGHGWGSSTAGVRDPGAGGIGYEEATETTELAMLTAQYARSLYGLNVYTNAGANAATGVNYRLRQLDAKNRGCTSLVSIHFNAATGLATGTESYIHSVNAAAGSDQLQAIMHTALVGALGLSDRGMRQAGFAVVSGKDTGLPATLLEVCFIDNPSDMQIYKEREDAVARALAKGLYDAAQAGF
jgi:N-acetylmuramoyl-L-alanine amidase